MKYSKDIVLAVMPSYIGYLEHIEVPEGPWAQNETPAFNSYIDYEFFRLSFTYFVILLRGRGDTFYPIYKNCGITKKDYYNFLYSYPFNRSQLRYFWKIYKDAVEIFGF